MRNLRKELVATQRNQADQAAIGLEVSQRVTGPLITGRLPKTGRPVGLARLRSGPRTRMD